jgi:hypothetical protein
VIGVQRWRRAASGAYWRAWRRLYAGSLNAPYLSGDLFRACCEIAYDEDRQTRPRFLRQFREAASIFVKTDLIDEFARRYARDAVACRVLVSGNSDHEIHRVPEELPPSVRGWLAQNTCVHHPLVYPLPIGLENQALARCGIRTHFRGCSPEEIRGKRVRVLVAFGPTTDERASILQDVRSSSVVDVLRTRVSPRRYQAHLRRYRFVLAPRGNGIDTHRFWEALYGDAIPIVRGTTWSSRIKADGVPCVEVERWSDVVAWTQDNLTRLSQAFPDRPSRMPELWEPFWRSRISALIDDATAVAREVVTP